LFSYHQNIEYAQTGQVLLDLLQAAGRDLQ